MIARLDGTYYYAESLAHLIISYIFGNVLTGKEKFESVAADVGKKSLPKQLGGGKIRKRRIIRKNSPKPVDVVKLEEIFFLI